MIILVLFYTYTWKYRLWIKVKLSEFIYDIIIYLKSFTTPKIYQHFFIFVILYWLIINCLEVKITVWDVKFNSTIIQYSENYRTGTVKNGKYRKWKTIVTMIILSYGIWKRLRSTFFFCLVRQSNSVEMIFVYCSKKLFACRLDKNSLVHCMITFKQRLTCSNTIIIVV